MIKTSNNLDPILTAIQASTSPINSPYDFRFCQTAMPRDIVWKVAPKDLSDECYF